MENLLLFVLSLPRWLLGAAFGFAGGALGYVASSWLSRISIGNRNTGKVVPAVALAVSVTLSGQVQDSLRDRYADAVVIKELKANRLYSVLFRVHPEAEAEMRSKLRDIFMKRASANETRLLAQNASAAIVNRYFQQHLISASDAVTYSVLVHSLDVMHRLAPARPEACVGYYLGVSKSVIELDDDLIRAESNLKADVIESSLASPSRAPIRLTLQ